jgi:hypothetical protein
MKPYSEDLPTRIVKALQQAGGVSSLSPKPLASWVSQSLLAQALHQEKANQGASLEPRKRAAADHHRGGRSETTPRSFSIEDTYTSARRRERLPEAPLLFEATERHKALSDSTIRRVLKRLGFSQKTDSVGALWNGTSG